jgi:hypothetical protein
VYITKGALDTRWCHYQTYTSPHPEGGKPALKNRHFCGRRACDADAHRVAVAIGGSNCWDWLVMRSQLLGVRRREQLRPISTRVGSSTMQTLQEPILLLSWVCSSTLKHAAGGFQTLSKSGVDTVHVDCYA